ncbi:MAG: VC0807 family protein [Limisphaerales bacterium]
MSSPTPAAPPKAENLWINLVCNAAFPAIVLMKLSDENRLGPVRALLLAISVPLAYGIYDLVARRKWNVFSIVGVVGTLLTGGLGLMKLSGIWFAVKEAAIPLVLAGAILVTQRTKQPLVRALVCNESVLNMPRVEAALDAAGTRPEFERLLGRVAWIIAGSFVLSAVLNFFLALWIMKSPPGTPEAAKELGRLTFLSFPVIVLPSMAIMLVAMFKLLNGLEKLTGLKGEEIFHQKAKPAPRPPP